MNLPSKARSPLEGERFQVVVIGGGINGVAIARECARAGRRTLLVEQHDFASGTTSRSTRIIHGGLRYLEYGEIGMVRESLRARGRLLRERPHLVHPVHFLLALSDNTRRSSLTIRTGLWLYRHLGGKLGVGSSDTDKKKLEHWLDSGHRWSIFDFEDGQCEFPERLVAEWLIEAIQAGAVARNHMQVLAVDVVSGKVRGVLLRDKLSGKEEHIDATWVINATGPWADRLCQRSSIRTQRPMVGGVRGSHIVLPRFAGAPSTPLYTEGVDRRPMFVIPWNEQILVGTTEIPDTTDPGKTQPANDEIEYLLNSLTALFPGSKISSHDIYYAFAGVRPLPFSPKQAPSSISRRHYLHDHTDEGAAGMISVIGGKLTTAAELARQCAKKMGGRVRPPQGLALVSNAALDPLLDQWVLEVGEVGGVGETSARSIVEWHGRRALDIAHMALTSAEMRAPLCSHTEHVVAEAVDAFANQCAITLADVLLRRVPVAWGGCWSQTCSRDAATRVAAVMGWNEEQTASELERFEMERTALLRKPQQVSLPLEAAAD